MIQLAIFDLDGTLVNSTADIATAGNAARQALGLAVLPVAEVASCVGEGLHRLIELLTPGVDAPARVRAVGAFQAAYADCCTAQTHAYPGVVEALDGLLHHGWTLAVATNKPLAFSLRILDHLGLAARFRAVRGGDTIKKPDPGQLRSIATELGGDLSRAWMIGDHHTDLLAGRAAGCRTVHCTWGIGHANGLQAAARADHPRDWLRVVRP